MLFLVVSIPGQEIRIGSTLLMRVMEVNVTNVGLVFETPDYAAHYGRSEAAGGKPKRTFLRRKIGEEVRVGKHVSVMVMGIKDQQVRLGIDTREEVWGWHGAVQDTGAVPAGTRDLACSTATESVC